MNEEMQQSVNEEVEQIEPAQQEAAETQSAEAEHSSDGKRFTQQEVNDLIGKRIAEERSKSEKGVGDLQQRLEKFETLFANFGKPPEQQQQAPQIDLNRPMTFADYQALVTQHQQHAAAEAASSKINEFVNEAKTKFSDFDDIKKQHEDVFGLLENDEVIANAAVATGQPFEFAYHVAKSCPDEFKKIGSITNPVLKFAEIIRLEGKLKQGARVPSVSNAPAPMQDERCDGDNIDTYDVQAARRRLTQR